MKWEAAASNRIKKVPLIVRPLAKRKIKERAAAAGHQVVSLADVLEAEARFQAMRGGRGDAELAKLMPQDNQPGAEMVVLEACRAQLSQCPNTLLDTDPWRQAINNWLRRDDISERLRARVSGDKVLYHHKLKIALAGCPNGCSRPQIADLALVGAARPTFDLDACTACKACAEACPDGAIAIADMAQWDQALCQGCKACAQACPEVTISLGRPFARALLAGKLGRHPRLATFAGQVERPEQAVELFSTQMERYLDQAPAGVRFSAWWGGTS